MAEPRLTGPESWNLLERKVKTPPPNTDIQYFIYTNNSATVLKLLNAKLLSIGAMPENSHGEGGVYKLRLSPQLEEQITANRNAIHFDIGFNEQSLLPLRLTQKNTDIYLATTPKEKLIVFHNKARALDPLIRDLRANGLLPKEGMPAQAKFAYLKDDGSPLIMLPITPALAEIIERTSANATKPLGFFKGSLDSALNTIKQQIEKDIQVSERAQEPSRSSNKPAPKQNGATKAESFTKKIPLSDDAEMLKKALVFGRKRMANGTLRPFISFNKEHLPPRMSDIDLRSQIMNGQVYRDVFPSLETTGGGMLIDEEDLSRMVNLLGGKAEIQETSEITPFALASSVLKRQLPYSRATGQKSDIILASGSAHHEGEERHYLYIRYAAPKYVPYHPLGAAGQISVTAENEKPRIERIEVHPDVWNDLKDTLNVTPLMGGASAMKLEMLDTSAKTHFSTTKAASPVIPTLRPSHPKKDSPKAAPLTPEERVQKLEDVLDMIGRSIVTRPDQHVNLLRFSEPKEMLTAEAFSKYRRRRSGVKDKDKRIKIRNEIETLKLPHERLVLRATSVAMDAFAAKLSEAGMLQSAERIMLGKQEACIFTLKADAFALPVAEGEPSYLERFQNIFPPSHLAKPETLERKELELSAKTAFSEKDQSTQEELATDPYERLLLYLTRCEVRQASVRQYSYEDILGPLSGATALQSHIAGVAVMLAHIADKVSAVVDDTGYDLIPGSDSDAANIATGVRRSAQAMQGIIGETNQFHTNFRRLHDELKQTGENTIQRRLFILNPNDAIKELLTKSEVKKHVIGFPQTLWISHAYPNVISLIPTADFFSALGDLMQEHDGMAGEKKRKVPEVDHQGIIDFSDVGRRLADALAPEESSVVVAMPNPEARYKSGLQILKTMRPLLAKEEIPYTKETSVDPDKFDSSVAPAEYIAGQPCLMFHVASKRNFQEVLRIQEHYSNWIVGPKSYGEKVRGPVVLSELQKKYLPHFQRLEELRKTNRYFNSLTNLLNEVLSGDKTPEHINEYIIPLLQTGWEKLVSAIPELGNHTINFHHIEECRLLIQNLQNFQKQTSEEFRATNELLDRLTSEASNDEKVFDAGKVKKKAHPSPVLSSKDIDNIHAYLSDEEREYVSVKIGEAGVYDESGNRYSLDKKTDNVIRTSSDGTVSVANLVEGLHLKLYVNPSFIDLSEKLWRDSSSKSQMRQAFLNRGKVGGNGEQDIAIPHAPHEGLAETFDELVPSIRQP